MHLHVHSFQYGDAVRVVRIPGDNERNPEAPAERWETRLVVPNAAARLVGAKAYVISAPSNINSPYGVFLSYRDNTTGYMESVHVPHWCLVRDYTPPLFSDTAVLLYSGNGLQAPYSARATVLWEYERTTGAVSMMDPQTDMDAVFWSRVYEHREAYIMYAADRRIRRERVRRSFNNMICGVGDTRASFRKFGIYYAGDERRLHAAGKLVEKAIAIMRWARRRRLVCGALPATYDDGQAYESIGIDLDEMVLVLNDVRTYGSSLRASMVAERLAFEAREAGLPDLSACVVWCEDCGIYLREGGEYGHDEDGDIVCSSCLEGNYRWSESMGSHIRNRNAEPLYLTAYAAECNEPDDWVTRSYARSANLFALTSGYANEDVYYEWQDEYGGNAADDDYDDDDDDYESSYRRDGLSDYHNAHRDFEERVTPGSPYPALGVELEVWAEDRGDAVREIRPLGHILERDGSLCPKYGFEIVTQPYGKPEWSSVAKRLLATLSDNGVVGYNAPSEGEDGDRAMYGIHITVSRRHLSSLQEARIMMFLCSEENGDFVRAVAQRMYSYGSPTVDFGTLSAGHGLEYVGGLRSDYHYRNNRGRNETRYMKKLRGLGKYCPINWKGDLAEFRIFQSTTHLPSFMKNLEFVWALIEWTNVESATGSSWRHEDFAKWLAARPGVRDDYPNLLEYLRRESYVVKGGRRNEPIMNTWREGMISALRVLKPLPAEDVSYEEANAPLRVVPSSTRKAKARRTRRTTSPVQPDLQLVAA